MCCAFNGEANGLYTFGLPTLSFSSFVVNMLCGLFVCMAEVCHTNIKCRYYWTYDVALFMHASTVLGLLTADRCHVDYSVYVDFEQYPSWWIQSSWFWLKTFSWLRLSSYSSFGDSALNSNDRLKMLWTECLLCRKGNLYPRIMSAFKRRVGLELRIRNSWISHHEYESSFAKMQIRESKILMTNLLCTLYKSSLVMKWNC